LHEVAGRFFHPLAAFAVRADQSSAAMGTPLFEQNGYKIYSLDVKADPAWADLMVQTEGRPVVVKPNGTLGVVTGALVVKFNDMDKVAAVASAENLHVNLIDAKSSTAFFMAPPGYSLLPGIERLRALPGVERVEMEIDQSRKVGK
jgi:UDP-N-acetylmuramyl tripeptide synthase